MIYLATFSPNLNIIISFPYSFFGLSVLFIYKKSLYCILGPIFTPIGLSTPLKNSICAFYY